MHFVQYFLNCSNIHNIYIYQQNSQEFLMTLSKTYLQDFIFFVDSTDMMCKLFETEELQTVGKDCFARALATVHVTYANLLMSNMELPYTVR